jgi:hypothetical protein
MVARIQILRSRSEPNVFEITVQNLRVWLQHLNLLFTMVDTSGRKVEWYTQVFPKFLFFIYLDFEMREEFGPLTKN